MLRGHGHLDQSMGADDRNHLAVEWVTPEGELVKLGSLGSTGEWFSGDGPGPSVRSLISSVVPPSCTPGVFTKVGLKLYHWPGPAKYSLAGNSPKYNLVEKPANMMARYYSFPTLDKMWEAEIKIGEAEIAMEVMGFNPAMVAANITTSNEEDEAMFQRLSKEVQGPGFFVIITGNSPDDFAYKKKVLETIIAEAQGMSLKSVEDPEIEGILLTQCTRISASIRETFRPGGYFKSIPTWVRGTSPSGGPPGWDRQTAFSSSRAYRRRRRRLLRWGRARYLGKTEIFCKFSPMNPEAWKGVDKWFNEQSERALDEKYFSLTMAPQDQIDKKIGPALSNYHFWWKKALEALDPNGVIPEGGISKLSP
jgi:glycolate oxidase